MGVDSGEGESNNYFFANKTFILVPHIQNEWQLLSQISQGWNKKNSLFENVLSRLLPCFSSRIELADHQKYWD